MKVKSSRSPALPPATTLIGTNNCNSLTFSDYNVENFNQNDDNADKLATQIVNALKSPTMLFLQEIQDNDGPTDDGGAYDIASAKIMLTLVASNRCQRDFRVFNRQDQGSRRTDVRLYQRAAS